MRVPGQGSSSSLSQTMKHKPALREARAVERNIYPPETVVLFSLSGPEIKTQKRAECPSSAGMVSAVCRFPQFSVNKSSNRILPGVFKSTMGLGYSSWCH